MRLSVKVETGSEDTVFVCRGEISKFEASDYLFNLITRPGRNNVVLDFAGVTGIDEHGLTVLVWGRKILLAAKRKLLLRSASGEVLKHLPRPPHPSRRRSDPALSNGSSSAGAELTR